MFRKSQQQQQVSFFKNKDNQQQAFLQDSLKFWFGEKTGHLNPYAFNEPLAHIMNDPVCGGAHWKNMIRSNHNYYVIKSEAAAIQQLSKKIALDLPMGLASVDLGPGENLAQRIKTLPFNQSLFGLKEFAAVDVNTDFATTAAELVGRQVGVPAQAIFGNFFEEKFDELPDRQTVFSLFGGLLCNFGREQGRSAKHILSETLSKFSQNFKRDDYLVVTQDTNQEREKLLAAYSHPDMALYVLSVLHRMKRDLPTCNFNPDAFECIAEWNKKEQLLSLSICLKKDYPPQSFTIGDVPFTIGRGKSISVVNCYKFSAEFFIEAAAEAGFYAEKLYRLEDNPIALHVFSYKGKQRLLS